MASEREYPLIQRMRDDPGHARLPQMAAQQAERVRNAARCHGHQDGDCFWQECPQLRDGEPAKSARHCPLDSREDH